MSTESELLDRIAALELEVCELRALAPGRLGPRPETQTEVDARTGRLVDAVKEAQANAVSATEAKTSPALCTTNGQSVADVRANQTNETGQHAGYIVLCPDERAKGFVRPYRDAYKHLTCGTVTTMGRALSETYARQPSFYSHTFCVFCNRHLPIAEFVWTADGAQVGS